jgi:hypothetical protein
MNQIAVMTVNVVAEAPSPAQGDTDASPRPEPRATSISEVETATTAPQRIAGQDTADVDPFVIEGLVASELEFS